MLLGVFLLFVSLVFATGYQPYTPVVVLHGINSDAETWNYYADWLAELFPGMYTVSMEVGNGKWDSIFYNFNDYVDLLAENIKNDPNLADGFNLVAHSQGGLVARAYIEKFNDPPVKRFASLSAPQAGIYCSDEQCLIDVGFLTEIGDYIASELFYCSWGQDNVMVSGYWKDPYMTELYQNACEALPFLNNEDGVTFNQTYKDNFASLEKLMLVASDVDGIISPWQSAWFQFYFDESFEISDLDETPLYVDDTIGLRSLDENEAVTFINSGLGHTDYYNNWNFFSTYIVPFLSDSFMY
eukprot:gnl/Chilomastix_cuspidata/336.p1 GENE.gnl/Chilomastix_cuspidata/336~~gnl/Chilomastix_cuspidata/336.p1  ORF type:complete len:298 (+),score=62.48 gnl/Chilomastix_cuspidata/336:89-982(+)